MEIWRTAWRNLWRNRRRTLVTLAAMALALCVMILYSSLLGGYLRDMERNITALEVGDLQVHAAGYLDDPSLHTRIAQPEALLAQLRAGGYRATPRLLAWGMAAAQESSAGVSFRGIDLASDSGVSSIHQRLQQGRWLHSADPQGVVIGRQLARILAVSPGAEIVALSQGADGALAAGLFRVRGVLQSIGDATDRAGVFMTAAAFRELFVLPGGAHQIVVRRPEALALPAAAQALRAAAAGLDVKTWRERMPTLASLLDSARGGMLVMFFIVYAAVAILVLNAMLMAVFERIRELGVLKALGVGPGGVLALMLAEASLLSLLAIVAGAALAAPFLHYLQAVGLNLASLAGVSFMGVAMNPVWRAHVDAAVFAEPIFALLFIVAVAVCYPSLRAAFLDPVQAMRHS